MDITAFPQVATDVNVTISVERDAIYTVDIAEATFDTTTYTLHYVGTMPYFDFPF